MIVVKRVCNRLRWITLLIGLLTLQSAYAEVPVSVSGPAPAIGSSYAVGSTQFFTYTVTNNVSGKSFPITVSGLSDPVNRVTETGLFPANDCKDALPAGPSTCVIIIAIKPTASDGGQSFNQTFSINYQGRTPYTDNITFSVPAASEVATLSVIPSTLTLSVTGLTTTTGNNSGTPRVFTITNNGPETATGVACPTSASPSITSITCAGCGTIVNGGTCTVTITPSSTPSAPVADTSLTPITLTIQGTNTNTLSPTVNVLTYGSFYQAGYLFSIIETVNTSESIGGTVAAETDAAAQSPGVEYSPGAANTNPAMYNGTNGSADTQAMVTAYGTAQNYSAGYCIYPNYSAGGYTDWYLPSVCQMGYGGSDINFDCPTTTSPDYIPNMQVNLLENNPSQTFNFTNSGNYWSSTASEADAPSGAWFQQFEVGGGLGVQSFGGADFAFGIRCVRAIT